MENKKEKTAPNVSVGADTEQPIFKNTKSSISEYEENIKSFEEMPAMRNKIFYFYLILHHLRILLFIHISPKFLKVIHLT